GDISIFSRRELRLRHGIMIAEGLGRLAVVVAGIERPAIRFGNLLRLGKLFLDVSKRRVERPIVEPKHQAHSEEIAAAVTTLRSKAQILDGQSSELRHFNRKQSI